MKKIIIYEPITAVIEHLCEVPDNWSKEACLKHADELMEEWAEIYGAETFDIERDKSSEMHVEFI